MRRVRDDIRDRAARPNQYAGAQAGLAAAKRALAAAKHWGFRTPIASLSILAMFNVALGGTNMATNILRLPAVKARTGLSRSTIYLRVSQGSFPAPVNLGDRAVGWLDSEIQAWLQGRIAARSAKT